MKFGYSLFLIIAICCSIFWGCSETKELDPKELGTTYFPLNVGEYRVYKVYGTQYNSSIDSTVFSYLLKESIVDSFPNLESGISFKILRQKKYSENDIWVTDSIWTARKNSRTAILVEHNVPLVNLTFPLIENKTWDGNKLNNKSEDEFEMMDIYQPYTDSIGNYENTVTVIQEDLPDKIVKFISRKEVYADEKGLAYKEKIILNYKQGDSLGMQIIESGLKYFQYLVEYGKE